MILKVFKFFIIAVLSLTIGFGAGYYTLKSANGDTKENKLSDVKTPTSTPAPAPAPSIEPEIEMPSQKAASAPGDVYIDEEDDKARQYYVLKEYNGRIAVYKSYASGQKTLMNIIDTDTNALPENDRKLLQKGIEVATEEDMLQLLEDYTS